MEKSDCKILITRDAICKYLGVGKTLFSELIFAGLPAKKLRGIRGNWVAHIDVIDAWFVVFTQGSRAKNKRRHAYGPRGGHPPKSGTLISTCIPEKVNPSFG